MANFGSNSSSLMLQLKVIGAKNIETKNKGNLFIRCYFSTGSNNNRRVQVNTKEIRSSQKDGYVFWDDSFSLECSGTEDSILHLKEESVFFELRWRNTKTFLGNVGSSQLIATAEMPWKNVFDAPEMEFQKWVFMTVNQGDKVLKVEDGVKPPALQIVMKIEAPTAAAAKVVSMEEMRKRRRTERLQRWDECGCKSNGGCCSSCVDSEMLLIGATLDCF